MWKRAAISATGMSGRFEQSADGLHLFKREAWMGGLSGTAECACARGGYFETACARIGPVR